jgi:GTP-binding protein
MDMLDKAGVSYRIVLTKTDKADNLNVVRADIEASLKKRPAAFPVIYPTSSETGAGIEELRQAILDSVAS